MPKNPRWSGWTLNFAHRAAGWVLVAIIVLAGGPTLLATYLGVQNLMMILLIVLGLVGAVLVFVIGLLLNQG